MSGFCTSDISRLLSCRIAFRGCVLAVAVLLQFWLSTKSMADITLAKIFTDHMVLQQNDSVRVWGTANPEEKLTISFSGTLNATSSTTEQTTTALADPRGRWSTLIKTGAAGGPFTLEVSVEGSETKVVVSDILIGEVWICAGESNMAHSLGETDDADGEIELAKNFSQLRVFNIQQHSCPNPLVEFEQVKPWTVCSSETAKEFSALAYFFGSELNSKIDVPVGLIVAASDSSFCETWLSSEALESGGSYEQLLKHWKEKDDPTNVNQLSGHFNGMIAPLTGIPLRGVAWYQGESNVGRGSQYRRMLPSLIKDWRRYLGQRDFSFYFVQLPPKRYEGLAVDALPEVWDAQLATHRTVKNTGMAVTTDVGDVKLTKNKKEIARRLALWALGNDYKPKPIPKQLPKPSNAAPNSAPEANSNTEEKIDAKTTVVNPDEAEESSSEALKRSNKPSAATDDGDMQSGRHRSRRVTYQENSKAPPVTQEEAESADSAKQQDETKKDLGNSQGSSSRRVQEEKQDADAKKDKVDNAIDAEPSGEESNRKVVFSGPIYKAHKTEGNRFVISFDHADGLQTLKNEPPTCFLICGDDKKFVPAIAKVNGESLIVHSPNIAEPVAVRFAWEDTSVPNLFNAEGLPASPFRTDKFDLSSKGIEY